MTEAAASEREVAELVNRWLELHNDGTPESYGSERLLSLYSPDVEFVSFSSLTGAREASFGLEPLRAAHARSSAILRNRRADLHELIIDKDRAALRYRWSATLAADLPDLPAGTILRWEIAHFITVSHGKIVRSLEYQVRMA